MRGHRRCDLQPRHESVLRLSWRRIRRGRLRIESTSLVRDASRIGGGRRAVPRFVEGRRLRESLALDRFEVSRREGGRRRGVDCLYRHVPRDASRRGAVAMPRRRGLPRLPRLAWRVPEWRYTWRVRLVSETCLGNLRLAELSRSERDRVSSDGRGMQPGDRPRGSHTLRACPSPGRDLRNSGRWLLRLRFDLFEQQSDRRGNVHRRTGGGDALRRLLLVRVDVVRSRSLCPSARRRSVARLHGVGNALAVLGRRRFLRPVVGSVNRATLSPRRA